MLSGTTKEPIPTKTDAFFESIDVYLEEVKRLLLEKDLREEWVVELIQLDRNWLEDAYQKKLLPVYGAFEVYITEEESAREPTPLDRRLKVDVTENAKSYLEQLVKIGLWGASVEAVATTLIHQQLASKLEAGLIKASAKK